MNEGSNVWAAASLSEGVRNPTRRSLVAWLCAAIACGCGESPSSSGPASPGAAASKPAYEDSSSNGPVTLTLRIDRTEIRLSDRITLEQELVIEPGFEADFPEYLPEDFDGLNVVKIDRDDVAPRSTEAADSSAPPDTPAKSPRRLRKRLVLEPLKSGDLAIAPLAAYARESGKAEESVIETKEIRITVKGIESAEVQPLRDARGPLPPPEAERGHTRLLIAAGGVAVLVFAGFFWWRLGGRTERVVPRPPPHEVAWEALRRLVSQGFIEKGEVEVFFVYLSAILREYVENRFEVHAPERTTEEFLEEAARSVSLAQHRARLGEFLRLSDEVKFARFQPEPALIQGSFDTVKRFIEETTIRVA
jgi:hypothetical protein